MAAVAETIVAALLRRLERQGRDPDLWETFDRPRCNDARKEVPNRSWLRRSAWKWATGGKSLDFARA
jgi:hypothetical protein